MATPSVFDRRQVNYFQQTILKQVMGLEDQNTNDFSKNKLKISRKYIIIIMEKNRRLPKAPEDCRRGGPISYR